MTSDLPATSAPSAQRLRVSPEQRRLLRAIPSVLAPWLSPLQVLRVVVQELSQVLGAPAALVSRSAAGWTLLAESSEESGNLGQRIANATSAAPGQTLPDALARTGGRGVATWQAGDRLHTIVPLPTPPSGAPVLLVLEGDWTQSGQDLADVLSSLLALAPEPPATISVSERLARRLAHAGSLTDVCDALLCAAAEAVPSRYASVAVPSDQGTLGIVAARGYPVAIMAHVQIESGRGVIGSVYERAEPLLVRDIDSVAGAIPRRARFKTKSCVAVPIVVGADVLAVLSLADRNDDEPFSAEDVKQLESLAAPAALALARVRTERHVRDLTQAAIVDQASGLFNRAYFHSRLQEELQRAARQGTPLSLQVIDVDVFKSVNDQYGHQAGDAVIRGVAEILRRSVRVFDVCARYGGDEFAVVMPGSTRDSAAAIAERIRLRIEDGHAPLPTAPRITVSIGVAELMSGDDVAAVIGRADRALYEAKRSGKNRVVATPAL